MTCKHLDIQWVAQNYVCAECRGGLITPWSPVLNKLILACSKDRSHKGYVRLDAGLESLIAANATEEEIQTYLIQKQEAYHMGTGTKLQKYQGITNLTEQEASHILSLCWPRAPHDEIMRAALLCKTYGLNPLMKHVFLIPFKNSQSNEVSWATVIGIKATRLLASRRRPYTYVDGPRVMTEEEQQSIFGKADHNRIWAICKVGDLQGNQAPGYGFWPRNSNPYGMEKGNTPENMAFIRAERNALDRLFPGEMPDVEVVDERFANGRGENVIDSTAREVPAEEPKLSVKQSNDKTAGEQPGAGQNKQKSML